MDQMQAKNVSNGFDVCLFDKKLHLHINSQQHASGVSDKSADKPSSMHKMAEWRSKLSTLRPTLPILITSASAILLLTTNVKFVCTVQALLILMASALLVYVTSFRVKVELLLMQCVCVAGMAKCADQTEVSLLLLYAVLGVCVLEMYMSRLYLSTILLCVHTGSVTSLIIFRMGSLFEAQREWMQVVVAVTTPVVLGCVWYSNLTVIADHA